MNHSVNCSSCGGDNDLYLVTVLIFGDDVPGRVLLYCLRCREERRQHIDVSIPLALVTPKLFAELYRRGKTASDPATAIDIVFGKRNEALQDRLTEIMQIDGPRERH